MKLNEKIVYCRKKSGLSQEALAEKIGVSRQAVSKWETGDAEPELNKVRLLCEAFGVSADWLLSEAEPQEEYTYNNKEHAAQPRQNNWVESVPGILGRLARRFGWLAGVYVSVVGVGVLIFGLLARFVITAPIRGLMNDPMWNINGELDTFMKSNPAFTLGGIFIVGGVIIIIAGVILALFLKKKLNK